MKKNIIQVVLLLSTVMFFSCTDTKQNKFETIKAEKKLVVGTCADYPPYEFHTQKNGKDEIVGFDIAIARAIADDLGVDLVIRDMDFDGLLAALVSGSVDIVLAAMTPTEARRENVDFSAIYYTAEHGLIIRKKDEAAYGTSVEHLKNRIIGAQRGTIQVGIAKKDIKGLNNTNAEATHPQVRELPKLPDLIMELKAGKIDAVVVELPVAENYVAVHPDLILASYIFQDDSNGSAIAVKKGETALLDAINKSITTLQAEGKIYRFAAAALERVEY